MAIHAYTSFSYSYLNRARVLALSLRRQHPDWVIWAVITDREPEGFRFSLDSEEFDRMITVDELYGAETDQWLFGHDIVEACTAVKGRAMRHILDQPEVEKVFYFDPDIGVFNSMDKVAALLDSQAIVLTPHQVDPEAQDETMAIMDNEMASLTYGIFNLGFIAVNASSEARRFAKWWDERLHDWCHDRLDLGLFVDQKWCNLIPCFFDDVTIVRDPGYNVASWNLSQRTMRFDDEGCALVNGVPMRFYHFTKLGSIGDAMTRRYAKDNTEVYELWWWYRQTVEAFTDPAIPKGWWYYRTFDDGTPIPKKARELYRTRLDLREAFPEPRKTGTGSFQEWLKLEGGAK